jgi:hypothetical protein
MNHTFLSAIANTVALAAIVAGAPAQASVLVDTGTPNGSAVGSYAFDGMDWYAGHVSFGAAYDLSAISAHLLGTTPAETFTVALYTDGAVPGDLLYSATATVGASGDGWTGVSGASLSGWHVAAGSYWVAFEIGSGDTLGGGSVTGALLDAGAPNPLAATAFSSGAGYGLTASPLGIGLRIEGTLPVPEPTTGLLLAAGVAALALLRRGRSMR